MEKTKLCCVFTSGGASRMIAGTISLVFVALCGSVVIREVSGEAVAAGHMPSTLWKEREKAPAEVQPEEVLFVDMIRGKEEESGRESAGLTVFSTSGAGDATEEAALHSDHRQHNNSSTVASPAEDFPGNYEVSYQLDAEAKNRLRSRILRNSRLRRGTSKQKGGTAIVPQQTRHRHTRTASRRSLGSFSKVDVSRKHRRSLKFFTGAAMAMICAAALFLLLTGHSGLLQGLWGGDKKARTAVYEEHNMETGEEAVAGFTGDSMLEIIMDGWGLSLPQFLSVALVLTIAAATYNSTFHSPTRGKNEYRNNVFSSFSQ
ncbi:hypothetical protein CSUI_009835 [Cystoisospora suis]|uniref:Transmembrane protein n=1 Tax=Cystoisospora suis TaxID=483139 RepID=A0A2C6JF18_9APIC|nr:hypothetical protein CSUI_009835 [Cystoisospora suis]